MEQFIGRMQLENSYLESIIECGSELMGEDLKKKVRIPAITKMLNFLSKHQRKRELYEIAGIRRQAYLHCLFNA